MTNLERRSMADRAQRQDREAAYLRTLHLEADGSRRRRVQSAPVRRGYAGSSSSSSSDNSGYGRGHRDDGSDGDGFGRPCTTGLRRGKRRPHSAFPARPTTRGGARSSAGAAPSETLQLLPVGLGGGTLKTLLRKNPGLRDRLKPIGEHERVDQAKAHRREQQRAYDRWLKQKQAAGAKKQKPLTYEQRIARLKEESAQRKAEADRAYDLWKERKRNEKARRRDERRLEQERLYMATAVAAADGMVSPAAAPGEAPFPAWSRLGTPSYTVTDGADEEEIYFAAQPMV